MFHLILEIARVENSYFSEAESSLGRMKRPLLTNTTTAGRSFQKSTVRENRQPVKSGGEAGESGSVGIFPIAESTRNKGIPC